MKFDLYWRLNCFFSYYYRVIVMSGVWLQGLPTSRLYCGQEQNWWTLTTRLDSSVSSAQTLGNWTFFHRGWIRVRITIRISIMPRIPDLQWIASCAHLSRLQWLFPLLVTSLYPPPPPYILCWPLGVSWVTDLTQMYSRFLSVYWPLRPQIKR